jgi:hypothetical protein
MTTQEKSLSVASRGLEIYQNHLQSLLESAHREEFVAIEPDSGDYFLGKTLSEAIQSARQVHPNRLAFALRIGHPTTVDLGVMAR